MAGDYLPMMPLYDAGAERRLVSALSLSPESIWPATMRLTAEDFGDHEARAAWIELADALRAGRVVDPSKYRRLHDPFDPPVLLPEWAKQMAAELKIASLLRRSYTLAES